MPTINLVLDVLQTVALVVAAGVAVWGLSTWRREMTGRRRAELAEEVLVCFYEARDIIEWARYPGSSGDEGQSRESLPGETEDEARYRNAHYVAAERLLNNHEFFAKLQALRYRFIAYFGQESAKPFGEINKIRNRVVHSSGLLSRTHGDMREEREGFQKEWKKWEQDIGWGVEDEDPIAEEVKGLVADVEKLCRPVIMGAGK